MVPLIRGWKLEDQLLAFSGFIIFILAVVPQDEGRSIYDNQTPAYRIAQSVFNFSEENKLSLPHHSTSSNSANSPVRNLEISSQRVKRENSNQDERTGKFLRNLLRSDPLNCMPQVMCELIDAKEPNEYTDTMNDYKYLVKEFLKSDEDADGGDSTGDDDDGNEGLFRTDSRRTKQSSRKSIKKKPVKKSPDDSSEEDSVSKPSEEEKADEGINGMAQLMELEDEEALEEKALADLVDEDPGSLPFVMSDLKRKENIQQQVAQGKYGNVNSEKRVKYGYLNGMNFLRNLNILNNTLIENGNQESVFRISRAIEDSFLKRKQRELEQTKDVIDRTRIAAEVAGVTRSARKCRALFDSCPATTSGNNGLVNNLRRVINGENSQRNNQNSISKKDIKDLVREINKATVAQLGPAANGGGYGHDIKVVLNLGSNPNEMGGHSAVFSNYNSSRNGIPLSVDVNPGQVTTPKPITTTTTTTLRTTTTKSPYLDQLQLFLGNVSQAIDKKQKTELLALKSRTTAPPYENKEPIFPKASTMKVLKPKTTQKSSSSSQRNKYTIGGTGNVHLPPSKILIAGVTNNRPLNPSKLNTYKISQNVDPKIEYKTRLQQASKLLNDVPKSLAKNFKKLKPVSNMNQVQERLHTLIKVIEPKVNSESEESDESSEEMQLELNPTSANPIPLLRMEEPTIGPTPIANPKRLRHYDPVQINYQPKNMQRFRNNNKLSWMNSVYDLFFKDKQTAPLPWSPDQWVPSAQRHGHKRSSPPSLPPHAERHNNMHNIDYSYYLSKDYIQQYQFPPPLGPYFDQMQPPHELMKPQSSGLSRTPKTTQRDTLENFRRKSPKSPSIKNTEKIIPRARRPVKYKNCCSSTSSNNKSLSRNFRTQPQG